MDQATVIAEIYEAAVVPNLWYRTLDRMAAIAGGEGTLLFAANRGETRHICSLAIDPLINEWIAGDWSGARNDRGNRLIPIREPRFLTDFDGFSRDEIERTPFYTDYLRPMGYGWCVGTAIHAPTNDTIVFSVERLHKKGPVEPQAVALLDALRPHLARAAMLSARAGIERARGGVLTLEIVGLPAAILTASGRIVAANSLIQQCIPAVAIGARDQLTFANALAMKRFEKAIADGHAGRFDMSALSLPLPGNETNQPAVAHVVPLKGVACDVFSGASYLFYVTALSAARTLPTPLLEALFDLTPSEARVASLIVGGSSVKEIAARASVKMDTVRAQLKSVFVKTGAHRQADLVRMLTAR